MIAPRFLPIGLRGDQLAKMDRVGYPAGQHLNPRPPPCKGGDLPLIYRPTAEALATFGAWWIAKNYKGGDPSAGSPTDTLLRLSPARRAWVRVCQASRPSPRPDSLGLTGGVCKEQGHIHRAILRRDYYGIHLHEGGLQPSVRTTTGFRD